MFRIEKTMVLLIIQLKLIEIARVSRGYFAVGGEYLVIPTIYLVYKLIKQCIRKQKRRDVEDEAY